MRRWILFAAALSVVVQVHAQRSYQDVTPGVSSRADVTSSLGPPARVLSPTVSEHRGPTGITRVEVEFDGPGNRALTRRIEAVLAPPVTRRALATSYGLGEPARRASKEGRLVEYFAEAAWLGFTYAGANESSGVERVAHFAEGTFYEVSGLPRPAKALPAPAPSATPSSRPSRTQAILGGIIGALGIIEAARRMDRGGWSEDAQSSLEGVYLSTYGAASADRCKADCAANASCRAFTFVRAGHPNPGDPSMCYLMSSVIRFVPSPCCNSGVKGGRDTGDTGDSEIGRD